MHPRLVESVALPLLFRRTWPRVRSVLEELRAAERLEPEEAARRSLEGALCSARSAASGSPHLRELYASHGVDASRARTAEDLARLPPMTKAMLRGHLEALVCRAADRGDLVRGETGGTTGAPAPYYRDTETWCRVAAAALRADEWAGWRLGERTASVSRAPRREPPMARVRRAVGERARNSLLLPGDELGPEATPRLAARLAAHRPVLVSGYASLLTAVAERLAGLAAPVPPPRAIVSSAEPLLSGDRARIEHGFGAPVLDRYGCRELGVIAQECGRGRGLHVVSEHVHVELDAGGRPARPGESGRVLVTLLGEPTFPFVRYDTGDVAVAAEPGPCPCGRPFPRIARIEGRLHDVLHGARGGGVRVRAVAELERTA